MKVRGGGEAGRAEGEKAFEVGLIMAGILGGCPNDAAERKALAFVPDLFSFAGLPAEITDMGAASEAQPAKHQLPAQTCRRRSPEDRSGGGGGRAREREREIWGGGIKIGRGAGRGEHPQLLLPLLLSLGIQQGMWGSAGCSLPHRLATNSSLHFPIRSNSPYLCLSHLAV